MVKQLRLARYSVSCWSRIPGLYVYDPVRRIQEESVLSERTFATHELHDVTLPAALSCHVFAERSLLRKARRVCQVLSAPLPHVALIQKHMAFDSRVNIASRCVILHRSVNFVLTSKVLWRMLVDTRGMIFHQTKSSFEGLLDLGVGMLLYRQEIGIVVEVCQVRVSEIRPTRTDSSASTRDVYLHGVSLQVAAEL